MRSSLGTLGILGASFAVYCLTPSCTVKTEPAPWPTDGGAGTRDTADTSPLDTSTSDTSGAPCVDTSTSETVCDEWGCYETNPDTSCDTSTGGCFDTSCDTSTGGCFDTSCDTSTGGCFDTSCDTSTGGCDTSTSDMGEPPPPAPAPAPSP